MKESLAKLWTDRPLLAILLIALIPRIVAVIFSKGYGMHDDHFGPIEQPFQIMHDTSYWTSRSEPHGHSIVYPSIHYALFNGFEAVGIEDPQMKMLLIRLLHALYSLLTVLFGYKIAEVLSDRTTAKKAGLLLALFWALPFLSVRNLIEVVCIPPLMAGFYFALTSAEKRRNAVIAGICLGLAFAFRYQTVVMTGMVGAAFLYRKQFRELALLVGGFLASALVVQGSLDVFAWGYPFASFIEYVRYNAAHGEDYTTGPWYNYGLLLLGALLPPTSFFLVFGMFKEWKKTVVILLPIVVFFVFHSYFPNKQERFILPIVPAMIVLCVVGWSRISKESPFWQRHPRVVKSLWVWFWILNTILLALFSTYYSKKSRVEAMYALYGKSVDGIVLAGGRLGATQPPLFYSGSYPVPIYVINNDLDLDAARLKIDTSAVRPNYVVLFGPDDLDHRVRRIESSLGLTLTEERRIEASFLDDVFYRLNPKYNKNETTFVYRADRKQ
jgi:hypothetical protein